MSNGFLKEQFFQWLSKNTSPRFVPMAHQFIDDIDAYCIRIGVLKVSLLETDDLTTAANVKEVVSRSKIFKFRHKNHVKEYIALANYYYDFLKSYHTDKDAVYKNEVDTAESAHPLKTDDRAAEEKAIFAEEDTSTEHDSYTNECVTEQTTIKDLKAINFESIGNYISTTPLWFEYFGQKTLLKEKTWQSLYIKIVTVLYYDYPQKLTKLIGVRLANCGRVDFARLASSSKLVSPYRLDEDFYLETLQGTRDYLQKIKKLLDICLVDYENLQIFYCKQSYLQNHPEIIEGLTVTKAISKVQSSSEIDSDNQDKTFTLNNIPNLKYTKPVFCELKDGFVFDGLSSWSHLYISVVKELLRRYPHIIIPLANKHFPGSSRIDIANGDSVLELRKAAAIGTDLFIEINHSAETLVARLAYYFSQCNISLDTITIKYTTIPSAKHQKEKASSVAVAKPEKANAKTAHNALEKEVVKAFINWMVNEKNIAVTTARLYSSTISFCENFMISNHIGSGKLFISNNNEARSNIEKLLQNQTFVKENSEMRYRYFASLKKFIEFKELGKIDFPMKHEEKKNSSLVSNEKKLYSKEIVNKYSAVLKDRFPKGYRLNSPIERKRFAKFFDNQNIGEVVNDIDEIDNIIISFAFPYEDRAYHPETVLDLEVKKGIYNYIEKMLETTNMLSVKQLFEQFESELLFSGIKNDSMLGAFISFEDNGFFVNGEYISKSESNQFSIGDEVKAFMKAHIMPITLDEAYTKLPQFPKDSVRLEMCHASEIVLINKQTYCHIDAFDISEEELSEVKSIISNAINQQGYISTRELFKAIEKRIPKLLSDNDYITTDYGLRNLLKYHLSDLYSFGNIISPKNSSVKVYDVYANFSKNHKSFTIDDIYALASELNANIYYDAIYDNAIRIDKNNFISNDSIKFDTDAIDEAISGFCVNDYITIKDIPMFLSFPEVGYSWNQYLLECYVYRFSKRFKLIHDRFNATVAIGAIVKSNKAYSDYYKIIVDALAHSDIKLSKDTAFDFLCKAGYLSCYQYKHIDAAVHDAENLRKTL